MLAVHEQPRPEDPRRAPQQHDATQDRHRQAARNLCQRDVGLAHAHLAEHAATQLEISALEPPADRAAELDRLATFLRDVAAARDAATQEQRNKLARCLFDEVCVEDTAVVAVGPRPELEPFFKLDWEAREAERDIAGDPDGIRTHDLRRDRAVC